MRGKGLFFPDILLFPLFQINIGDQCWAQSIAVVAELCVRISNVPKAQELLLPQCWLVGLHPCGKEFPCK